MSFTLEQLAIKHDFYCSETNYYSNEASERYKTFEMFFTHWHDADIDMNLMFRWDVYKNDDKGHGSEGYCLEMFFILQRKGIFKPIMVANFEQKDVDAFVLFAQKHLEKLKQIWSPF